MTIASEDKHSHYAKGERDLKTMPRELWNFAVTIRG